MLKDFSGVVYRVIEFACFLVDDKEYNLLNLVKLSLNVPCNCATSSVPIGRTQLFAHIYKKVDRSTSSGRHARRILTFL